MEGEQSDDKRCISENEKQLSYIFKLYCALFDWTLFCECEYTKKNFCIRLLIF